MLLQTDSTEIAAAAREPRTRTYIGAMIFGDRIPDQRIVVRNISSWGIGADTRGHLPEVGEQVMLIFPNAIDAGGMVRWVSGRSFGVQFDRAIDMRVFSDLIKEFNAGFEFALRWEFDQRFQTEEVIDTSGLRRL